MHDSARQSDRRDRRRVAARLDFRPDLRAARFAPYDAAELPLPAGDLWVFGYGSLMWDPGFAVAQARPARLYGYHRRLCLWSVHYRGTAEQPGLVLGLDRGGSCNGMAMRVDRRQAAAAAAYLVEREMLNNAYAPAVKRIYPRGMRDGVEALTFVSRRAHPQFARPLELGQIVAVVREAAGAGGRNRDYVLNTARHLSALSIERTELHAVAEKLR
ncbi:MAG: gamma-glutamylcyclotransferase [bacterium]